MGIRFERKKTKAMNILKKDLVLEIGSGNRPSPRAEVLIDKFLEDSSEREGQKRLLIDDRLIIADGENLPFRDKNFDYVIASHVLEHVENPARFLNEIFRVGKRGYIETPLPIRELINNWPFHKWFVFNKGTKLFLIRKTAISNKVIKNIKNIHSTNLACYSKDYKINLSIEWRSRINYQIFQKEPAWFVNDLDKLFLVLKKHSCKQFDSKIHNKIINYLRNYGFLFKDKIISYKQSRERKKIDIFSIIVCPQCKKKFKFKNNKMICLGCNKRFSLLYKKLPLLILK